MITVILVEPEGEGNLGAVARAMMNTGVSSLIIVNPKCNHLSEEALNHSVHAREILQNAIVKPSLTEAACEIEIRIAFSRRVGQWRKRDYSLTELTEHLKPLRDKSIALVFGNEKHGLSNEDILLCDLLCYIPSAPEFPSLNLSQAVMVALYELYIAFQDSDRFRRETAPRKEFDEMIGSIIGTLDSLDYFHLVPEWRLEKYLNKILHRASLDHYDTVIIKNLFQRLTGMITRMRKELNGKKSDTEISPPPNLNK
jgi:tRNA/rRNA methyltransferase